jgi:putative endonuclease
MDWPSSYLRTRLGVALIDLRRDEKNPYSTSRFSPEGTGDPCAALRRLFCRRHISSKAKRVGALGWTVYVLRCRTGDLYTGCTTDLERRVREHDSGYGGKFTRSRRPVTVVYKEESKDRSEALRREHAIKKMRRKEKLALVAQTALAARE